MFKKTRLFFVLTLVFISLGAICIVSSLFISKFINERAGNIVLGIGLLCDVAALIFIIIRAIKFGYPKEKVARNNKQDLGTVNVKPVKDTSQEENLYKQYEGLYKEGLISKEDLDKKRVELLGK